MASVIQPSFAGGEISPAAYGRVDLARYANSLKTCRNMIVRATGGVFNRSGTSLVCECRLDAKTRLIPFIFNVTQAYPLQFSNGKMRVIMNGGQVLEASKAITGTTNATPVVVTSNAHGYANGDEVFITGTGIAALDNRNWIVANKTANTFELAGSTAPGSVSATGTVARVFELTTPYLEADLPTIKYAQLADVMTLAHTGYVPKQLTRTGHATWTITDFDFKEGPFQEINVDKTKALYTDAELINATVVIKATNNIFSAAHVGMLIYIEQKDFGTPWEVGKAVSKGDIRRADGKYYKALNGANTGTLRPSVSTPGDTESDGAVTWQFLHSGYGIAKITVFTSATQVSATILNRLPTPVVGVNPAKAITGAADNGTGLIRITSAAHGFNDDDTILIDSVTGTTEANGIWSIDKIDANNFDLRDSKFTTAYSAGGNARKGGTYKWALGAWAGDQGFPGAVAYHQQRQVFAATPAQPQKGWMSGTNAYNFFGHSTPIKNDDAVSFRLAGNQVNVIRHLAPLDKLIVLTQGSEQVISGGDNDAIAPNAIFNKPQGYNGTADIAPVLIGDVILMLQDKGKRIRDIGFQFASDSYTGNDLSVLAMHLVKGKTIVAWAYQAEPFKCVWAVRSDGVLLALTYMREQQVLAWHRHDTDGFFEDVCVVPEGSEDAVYFSVRRVINGVTRRFIERMKTRFFDDMRDGFFVDCGLTYDGRNTAATTMTLSGGTTWSYQAETFTLTASVAFFAATMIGNEIHMTDSLGRTLRLEIIAFTSTTVVTVRANRDVPAELRAVVVTAWALAKKNFSGMDHLEGKTVSILADANVHPQRTIAAGAFTLERNAAVVHAGLPITADFETLSLSAPTTETLLNKQKSVSAVDLLVEETRGIMAGKDSDHLIEYKQRAQENYDEPVHSLTGVASIHVPSKWDKGGRIFVRQSDPLPLSILAAIPEVTIGGSGAAGT
jgi:hypothetical protein